MDVRVWPKRRLSPERIDAFKLVLEKTLESSLDCNIKPVNPKGSQSWIFIGRSDVESKSIRWLILWPLDSKNCLIGKDPYAGKDWRREEKGMTEDEMVGWHHWLYGHDFEQALGVGDVQKNLECCSPWSLKESDTTERLNWTELNKLFRGKVHKEFSKFLEDFSV